ncbi:MAG: RluA family pseudouridine synthase, partial [Clostridia bacterium]
MDIQNFEIYEDDIGQRIDVYICDNSEISRSYIKTLIDSGAILVNDKPTKAGYMLKNHDKIHMEVPEPKVMDLTPCDIPLDIVFEDEYFAVINKKQGMVVHPASGSYDNTLVNALLFHFKNLSQINGIFRPGIVHRLDKNTSGLLVVAKTDKAHISLQEQIATKSAKRFYMALVDGVIKADSGVINNFIDRSQKDRKLFCVSRNNSGRNAITNYKVIMRYKGYTLVEFELQTGRTHQIRVHSKHMGHPVVGDKEYGGSNKF